MKECQKATNGKFEAEGNGRMSVHKFSHKIPYNPEGKPRAAVVRYGAWGDLAQAMSIVYGLKKQGYWTIFICSYPSSELVAFDPAIDELIVQFQNQVPIQMLGHFWIWFQQKWRGKPIDKWCNLTESVEVTLLAMVGNVRFMWPPQARHDIMNKNYLEMQHEIAEVPYEPAFRFYPNEDEKKWAVQERDKMRKAGIEKWIFWALAGSSRTHKIYPHQDIVWRHVLEHYKGWGVVTIGDGSCADLESPFSGEPRIWKTSGKWTMRQALTMLETADVVVGPETGTMSCAAFYPMPKIVLLSHSTVENLTRDWTNTSSLWAPATECPGRGKNVVPACHKMLPSFEGCRRHTTYGTAQCCAEIEPSWVWEVLQVCMQTGQAPKWEPPV